MKKRFMALMCVIAAGMALSGCAAGNASGTTATAAPIVTNSPMPTQQAQTQLPATMTPDMSPEANAGAGVGTTAGTMLNPTIGGSTASGMTPAQADKLAEQIEESVERLSEIDDAEAVIHDDRVLVAVEFDDQYSAGLDERMKDMIMEAVKKVDDGLTKIEITDDSTIYGQIKSLGDRFAKATGLDELADDFGDLWNRITGM